MKGVMSDLVDNGDAWVCPSDRHLALRAQLKAGWSVRTKNDLEPTKTKKKITPDEQDQIRMVMEKATSMESQEQSRIGKMVERLEIMKARAVGNGTTQCMLCGTEFGLFGPRGTAGRCADCRKYVCQRNCGVETVSSHGQIMFLCKICSEERELWKKTGAWFYKGLPKYVMPEPRGANNYNASPSSSHHPSTSEFYSHSHSPKTSGQSSPRRRLPEPPRQQLSARNSGQSSTGNPPSGNPATSGYRPRWAEEVKTRTNRKQSADSDSSSDGENFRIKRQICRNRRFESDSESESDDCEQSVSPISSHQDSIQSPSPSFGKINDNILQSGTTTNTTTDTSDNHSIDSGVAHSDRSQGTYSGSNNGTALPESASSNYGLNPDGPDSLKTSQTKVSSSNSSSDVRSPSAASTRKQKDDNPKLVTPKQALVVKASPVTAKKSIISAAQSKLNTEADALAKDKERATPPDALMLNRGASVENEMDSSPDDDLSSLGTIEFTLLFDAKEQTVTVHIIKAQDLRAMDSNGFSDPYVKLHLLPGATKSTQLRTKTISRNLNPEWDEKLTYHGITEDEMLKKTLRLTVLDEDTFGHDFLGETRVPLKRISSGHIRKFNVYLEKQLPVEKGDEAVQERGKILISLQYVSSKSQLLVGIVRCAELIGMDPNGYSDPYVRVSLTPDAKKNKYKTSVKKKTCNPLYDSEFTFSCAAQELLTKRKLNIEVYDKDVGKQDDYIGGVQLANDAKGERLRHWIDCLKQQNVKQEKWHKLTEEKF